MEKELKIFVYEEGEPPLFHNGPCKNIYSTEGNFIHAIEMDSRFRTNDPNKAHVFFLPLSVVMLVRFVYVRDSHDFTPLRRTVADYVNVIGTKYPFWNRTLGADHFMLSCHDWVSITSLTTNSSNKQPIIDLITGSGSIKIRTPFVQELHSGTVQRQHIRRLQPIKGRITPGNQSADGCVDRISRWPISLAPPNSGFLRRRTSRPNKAHSNPAMGEQGPGYSSPPVPPGRGLLH